VSAIESGEISKGASSPRKGMKREGSQ